jgi:hypothetical protein
VEIDPGTHMLFIRSSLKIECDIVRGAREDSFGEKLGGERSV